MPIPRLGQETISDSPPGPADSEPSSHAVVIGGGMGGLLAARVLADRYARVTVIDRDRFPDAPDHRKGAPQSRHAHALLPRGQQILGRLFPGIGDELRAAGAASGLRPPVFVTPVGKLPTPPAFAVGDGPPGVFASRILIEWHVRNRLLTYPGVRVLHETEATGLVPSSDGGHVTGVRVRARGATDEHTHEFLAADLVMDASGRQSVAPEWLEAMGFGAPPEEMVHSGIGYASRLYRKPAAWPGEWDGIVINGRPPHNPRAGLILPIEDGLWHVSLGGFAGHHPPTDEAGFLEWARRLPDPSLYEAIRVAEPVTPIRGYRTPQNRLRRFERMARWPERFIVIGDAVCAFNPIYGQGMTTAALGAETLERVLAREPGAPGPEFARRFQRELAKAIAAPWMIASGEDLRWGVASSGMRGAPGSGLVRRYVERVLRRARQDADVAGAYLNVVGMVAPPSSLFRPRVLLPVLQDALTELAGGERALADDFASSPAAIARLRALPAAMEAAHARAGD